jgi:hypothetical protein
MSEQSSATPWSVIVGLDVFPRRNSPLLATIEAVRCHARRAGEAPMSSWQTTPASDCPRSWVAARCCTTQELDTHTIDCREVRYLWHPWHGQQVWIRRSSARAGLPVYQCSTDPSTCRRLLEIPQWMFEASVVCLIRCAPSPVPSIEALREVKALISTGLPVDSGAVVKAEHQSLIHKEDSDATRKQVSAGRPDAPVQPADPNAPLGESSARRASASRGASGSLVAGGRRRRRRGDKPGGGR